MKFKEFFKREDPYKVLTCTNLSIDSEFVRPHKLNTFSEINIISDSLAEEPLRHFLKNEYVNHRRGIERILSYLYVFYVAPLISKLFYPKALLNICSDVQRFFVIYCNQRIRLFDLDRKKILIFLKHGYSKSSFKHELSLRQTHFHPIMVPFEKKSDHMYEEPMLSGRPLARINATSKEYSSAYFLAFSDYDNFQTKAMEHHSIKDYISKLQDQILELGFEGNNIIQNWFQGLVFKSSDTQIDVSISHGDLHHGNIWLCNEKSIIIDWESIDFRAVVYDQFFLLNTIRPNYVIDGNYIDTRKEFINKRAQRFSRNISLECDGIRSILILEDFRYRLREISKLPKIRRSIEIEILFNEKKRKSFNV